MKKLAWIFGLTFLLFSCDQAKYESAEEAPEQGDYAQTEPSLPKETTTSQVVEERKIIKTANIRFQVKEIEKSTKKITKTAQKFKGFVADMNQTQSSYTINNQLSLRIPADKFDAFLSEIESESIYMNSKQINSQDVSEEYVDIESRLNTRKTVRDRYVEILRNQASTVDEVLNAEEKIRVIQEEIESAEGRLRFLNDRTSISTINLEIYQEVTYEKAPDVFKKSFLDEIVESFVSGWSFILNVIIGLVTIWPFIIVGILIFVFRHKIRNLIKK